MNQKLDKLENLGKVSIKVFTDPNQENMGLERYNYVVFPNTFQVETLAAIEQNGKQRYLTGLNEFAPEIKQIKDVDKRKAVIKDIRETIVLLEKERAFNFIDIEDKDFWNKVEMFKPGNSEIWSKIFLKLGNNEQFLNPKENLDDLIIVKAIENGGFSLVAASFEEAKITKKKWYLDRQIETFASKTTVTKIRNKALAILQDLCDNEPRKLFYIAKNVDANSSQYTDKTLADLIYENMDKYINGLGYDADKKRCATSFIELAKLSIENLKLKCIIKDACFYQFIITKPDGMMYETTQSIMLGRNISDVLEYIKNPINESVLDLLLTKVEETWTKR
jgi:hypothetical protein